MSNSFSDWLAPKLLYLVMLGIILSGMGTLVIAPLLSIIKTAKWYMPVYEWAILAPFAAYPLFTAVHWIGQSIGKKRKKTQKKR